MTEGQALEAELVALRTQVRALSDRQAILDVLTRYMAGVDGKDLDLIGSVFHPDAIDEHQGHPPRDRAAFLAFMAPLLPTMGPTAHYLGGVLIELAGDQATARYPAIAFHRLGEGETAIDSIMGARVVDRLARRAGEWRISHRSVTYDWNHDRPAHETWGQGAFRYEHG
jgi:hypothetical protein